MSHYQILGELGRGGMAVVYRAFQPDLDREVALKFLQASGDDLSAAGIARFKREMDVLIALSHPSIIKVLDAGEMDGRLYYAMELVQAEDLSRILKSKGPMAPGVAVQVLDQLLDALEFIHARGLVHRDIKPANIMLTGAGRAILMDFGVVRKTEGTLLTAAGKIVGTPAYLAPELITGDRPPSAPSDLWSLGLVAYEMLAGRYPFEAESVMLLMECVLKDPAPSVLEGREDLPRALGRWVARLLEKAPDARWASAGEARRQMESFRAAVEAAPSGAPARAVPGQDTGSVPGRKTRSVSTSSRITRPVPAAKHRRPAPARGGRRALVAWLSGGILALSLAGVWVARREAPPGVASPGPARSLTAAMSSPGAGSPVRAPAPGVVEVTTGFDRALIRLSAVVAAGAEVHLARERGGSPVRRRFREPTRELSMDRLEPETTYAGAVVTGPVRIEVRLTTRGRFFGRRRGSLPAVLLAGHRDVLGYTGIAAAARRDRIVLAWAAGTSGGSQVFVCESPDRGRTWTEPVNVSGEPAEIRRLAVAIDERDAHVAWCLDPGPIRVRSRALAGGTWVRSRVREGVFASVVAMATVDGERTLLLTVRQGQGEIAPLASAGDAIPPGNAVGPVEPAAQVCLLDGGRGQLHLVHSGPTEDHGVVHRAGPFAGTGPWTGVRLAAIGPGDYRRDMDACMIDRRLVVAFCSRRDKVRVRASADSGRTFGPEIDPLPQSSSTVRPALAAAGGRFYLALASERAFSAAAPYALLEGVGLFMFRSAEGDGWTRFVETPLHGVFVSDLRSLSMVAVGDQLSVLFAVKSLGVGAMPVSR
jgi:serine/threonine-protein kinase